MNNKIKEFAGQAGIHFHKGGTLDAGSDGIARFVLYSDMEKFAELIIQECISVASAQRNPPNLNYKPSERFVADLKQRFGIKDEQ